MSEGRLDWDAERGFRLTLHASSSEAVVRIDDMPVPADGTVELAAAPVALDRLEVLFKAVVEIEGQPGQIRSATVQLVGDDLVLEAEVEDAETGDVLPFSARLGVALAANVPAAGGPRPGPLDEDSLDWDDDTTMERLFGGKEDGGPVPKVTVRKGGIESLLQAISRLDENDSEGGADDEEEDDLDDGDEFDESEDPEEAMLSEYDTDEPPVRKSKVSGANSEALELLRMLVQREGVILQAGVGPEALADGVAAVLARRGSAEKKAEALSAWLMAQDAVEDVFIDDEELASVLERW